MKLLLDFLPILLFFLTFNMAERRAEDAARLATDWFGSLVSGGVVGPKEAPVLLATVVVILATLAQVIWLKSRRQKVEPMLWVSLVLVTVLGGATIWFHSDTFIKWKPTGLYLAMSLTFLLSKRVAGKYLLKTLLGEQLDLPEFAWRTLNRAWAVFFAVMAGLNLWVAFNFDTHVWVNFKLFGGMGLMLLFTLAQGVYISKHLPPEDPAANDPKMDDTP